MFTLREDEPLYAKLSPVAACERNAHGNAIDLIASSTVGAGTSLYINADSGVGTTANRNKQHGFHFTADNCIGCHACEAACSEKNDLPAHISFRSVGYVEGGTYPSFTRMNISMACNHCDDPVCLKGCPTNAYIKYSEYGAVIQDPETCFGCGYCTWVCPYNAPQLDPVAGHVQKCNMCVDRLEVGLKPACVSACVGNALDFGVIDSTPENREQVQTTLPGFPDPAISKPNIRFQQTKSLPREFTRTDSEPVRYHRDETQNSFVPTVDPKTGTKKSWNLAKLSSKENPLVIFTLITQAVVGAFAMVFLGGLAGLESLQQLATSIIAAPFVLALTLLQAFVLFLSTQHLGKPMRFYRGFNNLRYSPLSREALAISLFFGLLPVMAVLLALQHGVPGFGLDQIAGTPWLGSIAPETLVDLENLTKGLAVLLGIVGLYYMHCIYRIKARPFWNHWQVLTSFFGTALSVGGVLVGLLCLPLNAFLDLPVNGIFVELLPFIALGLLAEAVGHIFHARDLQRQGREGAVSFYKLCTEFGYTYRARNFCLGMTTVATLVMLSMAEILATKAILLPVMASVFGVLILLTAVVSRALFYVLVIPTTMPGAFFWKNKGFEQHARETGLAKMPQVGVIDSSH